MKRAVLFLILFVIGITLLCSNMPQEETTLFNFERFTNDDYVFLSEANKYCQEMQNWENYIWSTEVSYSYDSNINPTIVTAQIAPEFKDENGYHITFSNPEDKYYLITVQKGLFKVTGQQRDQIIDQIIEKVNGVTSVIVKFTLKQESIFDYTVSEVTCSVP